MNQKVNKRQTKLAEIIRKKSGELSEKEAQRGEAIILQQFVEWQWWRFVGD